LQLRGFDFSIKYRQGLCNQHADALSCKPVTMVAISTELDTNVIAATQQSDPILSIDFQQMTSKGTPSSANNWRKFPIKRYQQIWSQLTMHDSVLYRKVKTPTMEGEKLLLIVQKSVQRQLLSNAHDKAGHQGADRTMARLSKTAYWVGMGKDVNNYCNHCITCQCTKAASSYPAPLQPVIASRPGGS